MVDHQNSVDPSASPGESSAADSKVGFLSTTTGKLVVGGIALVLVLGAVGAAVFYFILGGAVTGAVDQAINTQTSSTVSTSSATTEVPVSPSERSLASTFTFRNVFAPTVKKTFEASATTGSTDATTTAGSDVPADTLFLQSIISENGARAAVFIWNGQTYTVGEGEQVGSSPWKALQINSDSVLMLYGDSQVTLSIGQGVGK